LVTNEKLRYNTNERERHYEVPSLYEAVLPCSVPCGGAGLSRGRKKDCVTLYTRHWASLDAPVGATWLGGGQCVDDSALNCDWLRNITNNVLQNQWLWT